MEHVFSSLLEILFTSELGKGDFFGKEVNFEDITLLHGVFEIAAKATIVFRGRPDIPANFAMLAKGGASVGREMSNYASARRRKRSAIEIKVAEEGSMGGKRGMNTGRAKKIECQCNLGQETVPFGQRKIGVDIAQSGDEMILVGADGSFSGIGSMLFRGNTLEGDVVLGEGSFEFLGTFVVEDMQVRWMALLDKFQMGGLPSSTDTGSLAIGNGNGMNGVGILMIENKNVLVAAAGGNGEATSLVGIRLEKFVFGEHHGIELMAFGFETWSEIGCNGSRVGHGAQKFGGAEILGLLILVPQGSSNGLGKMFGNEIGRETWKGGEMICTDGPENGGRDGSTESTMVILGKFTFGFVGAEYTVGLM